MSVSTSFLLIFIPVFYNWFEFNIFRYGLPCACLHVRMPVWLTIYY